MKLKKLGDLCQFRLGNLVLDMGISEGFLDYKKFIILGRARTGSQLLLGLLNSHRQIIAFGEIFGNYHSINWSRPSYRSKSKSLLSLIQSDPIRFLETKVFRTYPKHISAVGFKIFYYQAQNGNWKTVWSYLKKNEDLRIIHIKRRNILRTYLSEMKAFKTGNWVNTSGVQRDNTSISLNYEECLKKFTITRQQEKDYDLFFKDRQKINVTYEALSSDPMNEMKRIQEFLGVDSQVPRPSTYKQARRPLSTAISNYFELKEKFEGTPWTEFFED